VLKVKLAMAIVGISSFHLLRTFIEAEEHTQKALLWQTVIHITFLLSALALAFIDRMSLPQMRGHDHGHPPASEPPRGRRRRTTPLASRVSLRAA